MNYPITFSFDEVQSVNFLKHLLSHCSIHLRTITSDVIIELYTSPLTIKRQIHEWLIAPEREENFQEEDDGKSR